MKKTIIILLFVSPLFLSAQNARRNKDGNFTAIERTKDSTSTGRTIETEKGQFPVFSTSTGKLFYCTVSKTGKYFRKYLKVEGENK